MARVFLEYQGDSIELPIGETVIGRDVSCTLRFNDATVSRRHVRLVRRQDNVFAQDLGSKNATLLNGRRVEGAMRLDEGDELTIGGRRVIVRVVTAEEVEPDTVLLRRIPSREDVAAAAAAASARAASGIVTAKFPAVTLPPVAAVIPPKPTVGHRRHDRHRFELQLVYVSEALELDATSRDLSISGVFVCTQLLDPVGTSCQLTIQFDGAPPLKLSAIVRRVVDHDPLGEEPVGMGVEFVDVGAAEKAWLEKTIGKAAG